MKVLVIAAHPDDFVLGCGGTIAKLARGGTAVSVAIISQGSTSRYAKHEEVSPDVVQRLRECSHEAATILGLTNVTYFDYPDNRLDSVDLLDIVKAIERVVEEVKPQIVFTQHGGDLNNDHALVFRATLIALRPMEKCEVESLLAYEVPSSTDWSFQRFEPVFRPNVFYQIEDTLEAKQKAMAAFETEARDFPHPRSPQALQNAAQRWGSVVGVRAAEAFELVREVRR
jgi:LmbE family N-acetylglucosaminyl deacetylase